MPSAQPELTFACELDPARLAALFADSSVIEDLLALRARVALMVSDFSDERAGVVRRLNSAGIPVVGIPLLPLAEGYYFTADNAAQAAECYQQWRAWTGRHGLAWVGVGLDIEPDARIYLQIMDNPWGLARMLLPPGCSTGRARIGHGQLTGSWWTGSAPMGGRWRTTSSR